MTNDGRSPVTPADLPPRFWAKIAEDESGCWLWTAAKQHGGYGVVSWQQSTTPAHRATYQLLVGPIPAGHDLHHLCGAPSCVNPAHLAPRTIAENRSRRDGVARPPHREPWPVSRGSYVRGCRCDGCNSAQRLYKSRAVAS